MSWSTVAGLVTAAGSLAAVLFWVVALLRTNAELRIGYARQGDLIEAANARLTELGNSLAKEKTAHAASIARYTAFVSKHVVGLSDEDLLALAGAAADVGPASGVLGDGLLDPFAGDPGPGREVDPGALVPGPGGPASDPG